MAFTMEARADTADAQVMMLCEWSEVEKAGGQPAAAGTTII
jgi:hypothetical protein